MDTTKNEYLNRYKEQTELNIAQALSRLAEGVVKSVDYLIDTIEDENTPATEKYNASMVLIDRAIPKRAEVEGIGLSVPDLEKTFENIASLVEKEL